MVAIPTPNVNIKGAWARAYTTEQLNSLPAPVHTATHRPYDHHTLFEMVSNALNSAGFDHSEPVHYVGKGRLDKRSNKTSPAKFMTALNVRHESIADNVGGLDMYRQVFIQNSHDKTLSIRLFTGIEVLVCTNGMTILEVLDMIKRKQTKNVEDDIYSIVYGGIDRMLGDFKAQEDRVLSLQNTEMTDLMADHIIMDAMREQVINPAGVKEVWDNWNTPNYEEYKPRNAWSLVNAFTERSRGRSIFNRHKQHATLLRIVDDKVSAEYNPQPEGTEVEDNVLMLPSRIQSSDF